MQTRYLVGALALAVVGSAQTVNAQVVASREDRVAPLQSERRSTAVGTLNAGTMISLTLTDTVTSGKSQIGEVVSAVITRDVKDAAGNLVFQAGTEAQLKIAAFQPPMPHQNDARILLELASLGPIATASVKADVIGGRLGNTQRDFTLKPGTKVDFKLPQVMVVQAN